MTSSSSKDRPLKLLIVGSGIAGLTLALALEKAPVFVEYLLFEARDTLAPNLGASIGLAPNGSRILDQLGLYDDLEKLLEPVTSAGLHDDRGNCLTGERSDIFNLVSKRMSYPVAFLERQSLLEILSRHIQRRDCILTNKKAQSIKQDEEMATVFCEDGTSYSGDIVVGADGIHSITRREMWREAEIGGHFNCKAERESLSAEYRCLFGISNPVSGLEPGSYDVTHSRDVSTLVITGKGGKVYWFVFERLEQVYTGPDIPRFTAQDAEQFAMAYKTLPIRPSASVILLDIWKARLQTTLTALEEADFAHWTDGRIVCVGDSIHKMTPNSGAGGMLAIESAAALANSIHRLALQSDTGFLSKTQQIGRALGSFEHAMHPRASAVIKSAAAATRLQALRGIKEQLIAQYVLPYVGDLAANDACSSWIGAERIQYLPIPPRSLGGTATFNPTQGIGREEKAWRRSAVTLPFLAAPWAGYSLRQTPGTPTPHVHQDQAPLLSFWSNLAILFAIMLIESARRANQFNLLRFALVWGVLFLTDIRFVLAYCGIHYISSPISAFNAADMRMTDSSYIATILPVVLLPSIVTLMTTNAGAEHGLTAVFPHWNITFPVVVWAASAFSLRYILSPSTINQDRLHNVQRDLPAIRKILLVLCCISTVAWQYMIWSNPQSLAEIRAVVVQQRLPGSVQADYAILALGNVIWTALFMWDLKAAGTVRVSWLGLVCCALGLTAVGGIGALLGVAWLYREQTLATKRHRDAVVRAEQ